MEFNFNLEGGNFSRAGAASSEIKKILKQLNVDALLIKRIVVALYEAEVNVVAHAYEGVMNVVLDGKSIVVTITDKGPGIPDIAKAMQEGLSPMRKARRIRKRKPRRISILAAPVGRDIFFIIPSLPWNCKGIRCRDGITQYEKKL